MNFGIESIPDYLSSKVLLLAWLLEHEIHVEMQVL